MGSKAGKKPRFYELLDTYVKELHSNGTVKRWERERKITAINRKRRMLNRSIKENQVILDCLNGK